MSREIEELRAMAQRERTEVRELGAAWKDTAVDGWHSFARRHGRAAMFVALGAGYLGVRMLAGRGGSASKKRGLARASLGAVVALLTKALPAIAIQATSAMQREAPPGRTQNPSAVPPRTVQGRAAVPARAPPRLLQANHQRKTP